MIERACFLGHHGLQTGVGMIGIGGFQPEPDSAVEAFQAAGGAQMLTRPVREELLEVVVGDGVAEVSAQRSHGFGLRQAIGADHIEIAAQHGLEVFGFPDFTEVLEESLLVTSALFR